MPSLVAKLPWIVTALAIGACGSNTRTVTVTRPTTTSKTTTSAASAPTRAVYVASECVGHNVEPSTIVICGTGQVYADTLRYSSYGGSVAIGRGEVRVDDCQPDCASGQFVPYPGEVTLSGVLRCADHRLYYSSITFRMDTPRPRSIGPDPIAPNNCTPNAPAPSTAAPNTSTAATTASPPQASCGGFFLGPDPMDVISNVQATGVECAIGKGVASDARDPGASFDVYTNYQSHGFSCSGQFVAPPQGGEGHIHFVCTQGNASITFDHG